MIVRAIAAVAAAWILGFALWATTLPRPAGDERTQAIVVLTGGAGRIDRGLALLAAGRARRLFVSGTERSVRKSELAASTHRPQRLFDCCVDLGKDSVDTRSNARETADWVRQHRFRSIRLITTDWHMPRAHNDIAMALKGQGVTILVDAVPSNPSLATLLAEYQKYLLRRIAAPFGY